MLSLLLLAQIVGGPNLMREPPGLTPATAAQTEQALVTDPENIDARLRLVHYYFLQAMNPQRAQHIFWMIEHHPDSKHFSTRGFMMRPRTDPLNTPALYEQARLLWKKAVERQPGNGPVLLNAGRFIFGADPFEAEKLWQRARSIPATQVEATRDLVAHYSYAIFAALSVGVASVYDANIPPIAFRDHVKGLLAQTNEAVFPGRIGLSMVRQVDFPPDSPPPPEVDDVYRRRNEYGAQLLQRARQLEPDNPEWRVLPPSPSPSSAQPLAPTENLPVVTTTVPPVYPALAAQARIQGTVRLKGVVGPGGELTNLTLLNGHNLLNQAAQDAARQSHHPDHAGQTVIIEVPFRLP